MSATGPATPSQRLSDAAVVCRLRGITGARHEVLPPRSKVRGVDVLYRSPVRASPP